jgi:hypothetical protein
MLEQTMRPIRGDTMNRFLVLSTGLALALIGLPGSATGQSCVAPPADLVGWWPGDQGANDFDDIQNGNDGMPSSGVTFTTGPDNKVVTAFSFPATAAGEEIRVMSSAVNFGVLEPATSVSVDAWVRLDPNAPLPQTGYIVAKGALGDCDKPSYGLFLAQGGGKKQEVVFVVTTQQGVGSGTTAVMADYQEFICGKSKPDLQNCPALFDWHHVAGTFGLNPDDPDEFLTQIYLDGSSRDTRSEPSSGVQILYGSIDPTIKTDDLAIGNFSSRPAKGKCGGDGIPFLGDVDEVEIFSRAISQAEIQSIVSADSAGKCKGIDTTVQIAGTTRCTSDLSSTTFTIEPAGPVTIVGTIGNDNVFSGSVVSGLATSPDLAPNTFAAVSGPFEAGVGFDEACIAMGGPTCPVTIDLSGCSASTCRIDFLGLPIPPPPALPVSFSLFVDPMGGTVELSAEVQLVNGLPTLITFEFTSDSAAANFVPLKADLGGEAFTCTSDGGGSACLGDADCTSADVSFDGVLSCKEQDLMNCAPMTAIRDVDGLGFSGTFVSTTTGAVYLAEPVVTAPFDKVMVLVETSDGTVDSKELNDNLGGSLSTDIVFDIPTCVPPASSGTVSTCALSATNLTCGVTGLLEDFESFGTLTLACDGTGSVTGTAEVDFGASPPALVSAGELQVAGVGFGLSFESSGCSGTCASDATGDVCLVGKEICFDVAVEVDGTTDPFTCGGLGDLTATLWAGGEAINKARLIPEGGVPEGFVADFDLEFTGTAGKIDLDDGTTVTTLLIDTGASGVAGSWSVPKVATCRAGICFDGASPRDPVTVCSSDADCQPTACTVELEEVSIVATDTGLGATVDDSQPPAAVVPVGFPTNPEGCNAAVSGDFLAGGTFSGSTAELNFNVENLDLTVAQNGQAVCTTPIDAAVFSRLTRSGLEKVLVAGPVAIGAECPTEPLVFTFAIKYEGPAVTITDIIPAEWEACAGFVDPANECQQFLCDNTFPIGSQDCQDLVASLGCQPSEGGLTLDIGNPGNSATNIAWELPAGSGGATLTCTIASRAKPQNQNCEYNPSTCGTPAEPREFFINRGAQAAFSNGAPTPKPGEPAVDVQTDPLVLTCPAPAP